MAKIIYIYLNNDDLTLLLKELSFNEIVIYNKDGLKVDKISAISNGIEKYYLGKEEKKYIEFTPCWFSANYLQEACFYTEKTDEPEGKNLFNQLKKYIRLNFRISSDKSYYIGNQIYQDWLHNKYCFPVLFEYQKFCIENNRLNELFDDVIKEGYSIRNNKVRLRNINNIDLGADSFVIFKENTDLITTIIRKSFISYEYGSDCLFVYKRDKKKQIEILLDQRRMKDSSSHAAAIFQKLQEKWS